MNYEDIKSQAMSGLEFFMNDDQTENEYIIILQKGGTTIDPVTGKKVTTPELRGSISGLVRDVKDRDINGETILAGDKRGVFGASDEYQLKKGMVIKLPDADYVVVNPRPIDPSGRFVVMYRPVLRRAGVA